MARTVQESRVVLKGDNKAGRAFAEAGRQADTLQRKFTGLSFGAGVSAAAVAGMAAGLVVATKRAVENADAIGKTADKLGIGTEALQEYRHAAELTGVEQSVLEMGLQRLTRRLGEIAETGKGTAKPALDALGISIRDSTGRLKTLDEILPEVADGLSKVGDQTRRLSIAQKLFDSEGVALVNTLAGGAAGLEAMRREARELGIVLDEDVRQAERANDALTRMEKTVGVNLQNALLTASPLIVKMGEIVGEAAVFWADLANNIALATTAAEEASLAQLRAKLGGVNEELANALRLRTELAEKRSEEFAERQFANQIQRLEQEKAALVELMRAREAEAASRTGTEGGPGGGGGTTGTGLSSEREAQAAERIQAANERLLFSLAEARLRAADDEFALLDLRLARQLDAIEASKLAELEKQDAVTLALETAQLEREELERRHRERREAEDEAARERGLSAAERQAEAVKGIWESGLQGQLQTTGDLLGQIAQLQGSKSKAMFKIGKAAAIGQAVMDTHAAAIGAYKALASIPIIGPALGTAAAAAALLYGAARVKSIASQKFGGSSNTSGGGAPAAPSVSTPPGGTGGGDVPDLGQVVLPPRQINLQIASDSGMVTLDWVINNLIPTLNEALDDGTVLNITQEAA